MKKDKEHTEKNCILIKAVNCQSVSELKKIETLPQTLFFRDAEQEQQAQDKEHGYGNNRETHVVESDFHQTKKQGS